MKNKILLAAFLCGFLASCRGPLKTTINAIDDTWQLIGREYISYVEADTSLTKEGKEICKKTATQMNRLIKAAKDSYGN